MSAALVTLQVEQGADFTSDTYVWQTSAGALVDLSGATAILQARTRVDNSSTLVFAVASGAGITLGGVAGTVVIKFNASATELVAASEYPFTLMITVAGVTYMFLSGVIEVRGSTV